MILIRAICNVTCVTAVLALLAPHACRGDIRCEAFSSAGFGVAKVTIDLPPQSGDSPMGDDRFAVTNDDGNVLYPAMSGGGKGPRILENLLGVQTPKRLTFHFLFLGQQPFEIAIFHPEPIRFTVQPIDNPGRHRRLFEQWWREYSGMYERVHRDAEYPVGVQTYLTALWSKRLGLSMPELEGFLLRDQQKGGTWLGKTIADEAYRASVLRDLTLDRLDGPAAVAEPLQQPAEPIFAAGDIPEEIEALARVVPIECFYVRFGSFQNYSWTKSFTERWQGDLANLVALRSIRRPSGEVLEQQLGLSESALSAVLGPTVISDVAFIGLDPYMRDGAAFGILFEAKNNFFLSNSLSGQRRSAAGLYKDAAKETIELAGKKVSYVHTPGGELRSYYAQRDSFHLVTTSRELAKRFLEAGETRRSLAQSPSYQAVRSVMPAQSNGTIFAHLSREFWDHLTSPSIRVELERRQRSLAEMESLTLARYAAAQELVPAKTVEELIEAGYLPAGFGRRADGSQLVVQGDVILDSKRGVPGQFVPVADMPAESVTSVEAARYQEFVQTIRQEAGVMPAITAEIDRQTAGEVDALEHVRMRLRISDYQETKVLDLAKRLGGPSTRRVAPILGDVVSVEALIKDPLGGGKSVHIFAGLRNAPIPLGISGGGLSLLTAINESVRGYVGFWPKPAIFETLLGRPRGPLDSDGIAPTSSLFKLWTRRLDGFFLFSFKRDVLIEVGSQLAMVDTPEAAQARLFIDNLAGSQVEYAANAFGYARARQTSASGSRFMNSLHRQLSVPKSECQTVANRLIGGEFVCPLGGQYLAVEIPGGVQAWASTAAAPNNQFSLTEIPDSFRLPLLQWFRGLDARLTRTPDDALLLLVEIQASGLLEDKPAGEAPQPVGPEPSDEPREELPLPPAAN